MPLLLSVRRPRSSNTTNPCGAPITIPWFAFLFMGVIAIGSVHPLPPALKCCSSTQRCLRWAWRGLGLRKRVRAIREAGA